MLSGRNLKTKHHSHSLTAECQAQDVHKHNTNIQRKVLSDPIKAKSNWIQQQNGITSMTFESTIRHANFQCWPLRAASSLYTARWLQTVSINSNKRKQLGFRDWSRSHGAYILNLQKRRKKKTFERQTWLLEISVDQEVHFVAGNTHLSPVKGGGMLEGWAHSWEEIKIGSWDEYLGLCSGMWHLQIHSFIDPNGIWHLLLVKIVTQCVFA